MEDYKIAKDKKKKAKKDKKSNDGITGYLLSFIILVLIGLNFLFVVSWGLHALEKIGMSEISDISLIERVTNPLPQKKLRVEIFNACGVQGAAKKLTDYLRKFDNVDVVFFDNYRVQNLSSTYVIDRTDDDMSNAKAISRMISDKAQRLMPQISPDRQVEVTILIGKNYEELKAFK